MTLTESVKTLPRLDVSALISKVVHLPEVFWKELYIPPTEARVIGRFLIERLRKRDRRLTFEDVLRLPGKCRQAWRGASTDAKTALKWVIWYGVLPTLAVLVLHV